MSQPTTRELDAVSAIPVISNQDVQTLYLILQVLGFDIETIALMWGRSVEDVQAIFSATADTSVSIHTAQMTGKDLAWFCDLIAIKPKVIQQGRHFDESERRQRHTSHKAGKAYAQSWQGPPTVCTVGSASVGRAFVGIYFQVEDDLCGKGKLSAASLKFIKEGSCPIKFHALREVVETALKSQAQSSSLSWLQSILEEFPPGIRSVEDAFEVLAENERKVQQEKETMVIQSRLFTAEFTRRGLGPTVAGLAKNSAVASRSLKQIGLSEEAIADLAQAKSSMHPNEFSIFMQSPVMRMDDGTHAVEIVKLKKMEEWWKGVSLPQHSLEMVRISEKAQAKIAAHVDQPNPYAELPMGEVVKCATVQSDIVEVDNLGIEWNWTKRMVKVSGIQIPLDMPTNNKLASEVKNVSKRLFNTLNAFRLALGTDWPNLLTRLDLPGSLIFDLKNEEYEVKPTIVGRILAALSRICGSGLTTEHLFGIKRIKFKAPTSKTEEVELAFEKGDAIAGYRLGNLMRSYRQVKRWLCDVYSITDDQIKQIEYGQLVVPLAVQQIYLYKLQEWFEGATDPVIPRSYKSLLRLDSSDPVRSKRIDPNQIPHQDWFNNR